MVATAGLLAASGCGRSEWTSMVVAGNGFPCRQAITLSKPGGGAIMHSTSRGSGEGEAFLVV